ncbi:protein kintoun [Chanos chanos]|uniref:Protein kintoun n=1 Tax=Chanos chanos TaxID=29144 RepID=A0A6J2WAF0_CHACN|nr:protein kintoun [Chanos chanos]
MDFGEKLEELNLTSDEVDRFSKALKDDKFRQMLREYAEEISNPENKKKYEEEIKLLEEERGMDVKFIHPKPHHVLKTSANGKEKCFINVCSNDLIGKPVCKAGKGEDGKVGQHWSLPYSLTPGRPDRDVKGNKCMIYDVVFHPDTLYIAGKDARFLQLVNDTAIQAVQDSFKLKLDKNNTKVLKTKYKGVPHPAVIRKPIPGHVEKEEQPFDFPYPDQRNASAKDGPRPLSRTNTRDHTCSVHQSSPQSSTHPTEPHHTLKYRSVVDLQDYRCARDSARSPRPKAIVVTVDLPLLKSAADASLDVSEKRLLLESQKPAYKLELALAYPVDENKGEAKFNKAKKQLTITLPVLPLKEPLVFGVEDQRVNGNAEEGDTDERKDEDEGREDANDDASSLSEHERKSDGESYPKASGEPSTRSQNCARQPLSFEEDNVKIEPEDVEIIDAVEENNPPQCLQTDIPKNLLTDTQTDEVTVQEPQNNTESQREGGCSDTPLVSAVDSSMPFDLSLDPEEDVQVTVSSPNFGERMSNSELPCVTKTASPQQENVNRHCLQHLAQQDRETTSHSSELERCDSPRSLEIPTEYTPLSEPHHPSREEGEATTVQGTVDVALSEEKEPERCSAVTQGQHVSECRREHPPVVLRETDPQDGTEAVISDHSTSAGFSFQNTLLYELD